MGRVNAASVTAPAATTYGIRAVACVIEVHAVWNRPDVQLVHDAMGAQAATATSRAAVNQPVASLI